MDSMQNFKISTCCSGVWMERCSTLG